MPSYSIARVIYCTDLLRLMISFLPNISSIVFVSKQFWNVCKMERRHRLSQLVLVDKNVFIEQCGFPFWARITDDDFVISGVQKKIGLREVDATQRVCYESHENPFNDGSEFPHYPLLHHNIATTDLEYKRNYSALAPLLARFARRLGCSPAALTVDDDELRLLRYQQGGLFAPHRDTVKRCVIPGRVEPNDRDTVCRNVHIYICCIF